MTTDGHRFAHATVVGTTNRSVMYASTAGTAASSARAINHASQGRAWPLSSRGDGYGWLRYGSKQPSAPPPHVQAFQFKEKSPCSHMHTRVLHFSSQAEHCFVGQGSTATNWSPNELANVRPKPRHACTWAATSRGELNPTKRGSGGREFERRWLRQATDYGSKQPSAPPPHFQAFQFKKKSPYQPVRMHMPDGSLLALPALCAKCILPQ